MGRSIAKVVKEIVAGSDASAVNFILLRVAVNCVAGVSDFIVGGDVTFVDPFKNMHTVNVTIALEESRKFVDTRCIPALAYFCNWVLDEFLPRCTCTALLGSEVRCTLLNQIKAAYVGTDISMILILSCSSRVPQTLRSKTELGDNLLYYYVLRVMNYLRFEANMRLMSD